MRAIKSAIVMASVLATPPLFASACAAAYAQRGYLACGGEFGVLALPLIAGILIYGFGGD